MMIRALLLLPVLLGAAEPDERYCLLMSGYQGRLNRFNASHTFATFVRTDGSPQKRILETHTISWLPADLRFTILDPPEPGRNFTLAETLDYARANGWPVRHWGPYGIHKELFDKAKTQAENLKDAAATGRILYRADDRRTRAAVYAGQWGGAINCIHAVSDIAGIYDTGILHGYSASEAVLGILRQWVVDAVPDQELFRIMVQHGRAGLDDVAAQPEGGALLRGAGGQAPPNP